MSNTDSNESNGEFPDWWDFEKDGPEVTLLFKRFDAAVVRAREVPVAVGTVKGVERSVFVWPEGGLHGRFRDHLVRRPVKRIEAGERITIRRGEKRPSQTNPDRTVWTWSVTFHDAPALSQSDLFGLDDEKPGDTNAADGEEVFDDDIPF